MALPSNVVGRYTSINSDNAETALLEMMSSLSSLILEDHPSCLWRFIWYCLTDHAADVELGMDDNLSVHDEEYRIGWKWIGRKQEEEGPLGFLSPFDVHVIAMQCLVFDNGGMEDQLQVTSLPFLHSVLLSLYALYQCPEYRQKQGKVRWKRDGKACSARPSSSFNERRV